MEEATGSLNSQALAVWWIRSLCKRG